ncbi:hypothetical protein MJ564_02730 [Escherichia coli]|nr:hypothetical protein MJ564_02730 [Escherichia coli]
MMDIPVPRKLYSLGTDPNVSQNLPFGVMDSRLAIFRLKVFVPLLTWWESERRCLPWQHQRDPLVTPVYTISFWWRLKYRKTTFEVNTRLGVEFDFGAISASLFMRQGEGNRPTGVLPGKTAVKWRNVAEDLFNNTRPVPFPGQAMVSGQSRI